MPSLLLLAAVIAAQGASPLETLKKGKNFQVRLKAVMSIARTHDPALLPGLQALARDPKPMTRALTAIAVAGYPIDDAMPILVKLSQDRADVVRKSAAAALSDLQRGQEKPDKAEAQPAPAVHEPHTKNGPRLALDDFETNDSPEIALIDAARVLSDALDDSPLPLWTGEVGTSGHKATYALLGSADWSEKKTRTEAQAKVRLHGTVVRLPEHRLLGDIDTHANVSLPLAATPADRVNALQKTLRQACEAAIGDIVDIINVERQGSGEPLLR